jgi:uncharacterized RDD family membrane protein YckC
MDQEENPYRPPSSPVRDMNQMHAGGPAGKWRRFGTFVVDYLCFMVVGFIVGVAVGLIFGQRGIVAMQRVPNIISGSVVFFCYYVVFEGIWSRTPGKWVLGTVVTNEAGTKPSMKQVLGRTACRFIPFEAFSFLFDATGWHDSIPHTRVVRCR